MRFTGRPRVEPKRNMCFGVKADPPFRLGLTPLRRPRQTWILQTALKRLPAVALAVFHLPLFGQYAGPALLSRGEVPTQMAVPQIDFRPFLNLSATYGTGLAGVRVTDQGTLADSSSAGIMLGWGISGLHSWRHTKVGLDYGGNVT